MDEKKCNICGEIKSIDLFSKTKQLKSGYKGHCKDCHNSINKKYYSNPKNYDRQREWAKNNPESRKLSYKKHNIKKYYGLSWNEYEKLLERFNNKCGICGGIDPISLSVDHDHKTGKVRGLLCNNCNNGLGRFKDSPELLAKAIEYLLYENPL